MSGSTRVAAIDCGTNSIRLLVADVTAAGVVEDLVRTMEIVRLGQGVDATGSLSEAALARTFTALDGYAATIGELGVASSDVRMAATSATRDADNRNDFVRGVMERLGIEPTVLTGAQEAELSFVGASSALASGTPSPWLIADIGGGSTECVIGDASGVRAARSVDIGCVRITERRLHGDPPTAAEITAATAEIDGALGVADADVGFGAARTLVGLAGSVTTVAALLLGLEEYDADAIHGASIPAVEVHRISTRLLSMTRAERAALPVMHAGRVDVIGGGALILSRLVTMAKVDSVVASEHDILDGIALWAAGRR